MVKSKQKRSFQRNSSTSSDAISSLYEFEKNLSTKISRKKKRLETAHIAEKKSLADKQQTSIKELESSFDKKYSSAKKNAQKKVDTTVSNYADFLDSMDSTVEKNASSFKKSFLNKFLSQ
ncbi:MAG: hypothetical protein ACQESC_04815 [Nanobdellota archaeon]